MANFLPGVLVALLLIVTTFLAAVLLRVLLIRALRGLDFDRRVEQSGAGALVGWTSDNSLSQAVARGAYWTIVVLGLLVSLTALNATIPARLALSVFEYLPHLVAALLIVIAGAIAARFMARSVLIGAVNMQIQHARLVSLGVKWLVLLVTVAMALDHLGIGRTILLIAFGILFGGVVLSVALAVGLGAKDAVRSTLERRLREPPQVDSRVDHV